MDCFRLVSIFLVMTVLNYFPSKACSDVEIVSRASWVAREPFPYYKLTLPIYHIIIAHTVTPECWNLESCSARMRSMQNYHMNTQGFPDIGFNFVIGGDGRVYEGSGFDTQGAHTKGFNSKSLGIAFIGEYTKKVPNDSMMMAARKLIVCGIKKGIVAKTRQIHGARDAVCTKSPGDALYELLKTWPRFKGGRLPGYTC